MGRAYCATQDPETWFPSSAGPEGARQARFAAQLCQTFCPVIAECSEYRKQFGFQFGVWGGRQAPKQKAKVTDLLTEAHGTEGAYKRHYRRGEQPCQLCRDGHARARWEREEKRRKQRAG